MDSVRLSDLCERRVFFSLEKGWGCWRNVQLTPQKTQVLPGKKQVGVFKQHEVSAACQEICDSHSLKKLGFDRFFFFFSGGIRPAWMKLPQFFEEAA